MIIERVFGQWKRRFPILSRGIRVKLETALSIIVATAVLFNISKDATDLLSEEENEEMQEDIWNMPSSIRSDNPLGNAVRRDIINRFF